MEKRIEIFITRDKNNDYGFNDVKVFSGGYLPLLNEEGGYKGCYTRTVDVQEIVDVPNLCFGDINPGECWEAEIVLKKRVK